MGKSIKDLMPNIYEMEKGRFYSRMKKLIEKKEILEKQLKYINSELKKMGAKKIHKPKKSKRKK